jgi:hypothetical protein
MRGADLLRAAGVDDEPVEVEQVEVVPGQAEDAGLAALRDLEAAPGGVARAVGGAGEGGRERLAELDPDGGERVEEVGALGLGLRRGGRVHRARRARQGRVAPRPGRVVA